MTLVFMMAHLAGCLWMAIGTPRVSFCSLDPTWASFVSAALLDRYPDGSFLEESWPRRLYQYDRMDTAPTAKMYLLSFYWALTTLSTVGYGDINAVSLALSLPRSDIARLI